MRAVLLAAGEGKRLRPYFNRPKPLVHLLGRSLIERNILALRECGIKDVVIITGFAGDRIKHYLGDGGKWGVRISYLHNPDWPRGNGMSAYTFKQAVRENEKFLLLMGDHLFPPGLLKDFIAEAERISHKEILLAADRRLTGVYDLDECTKVKEVDGYALTLGKQLEDYNAVDCGLFVGTGALIDALHRSVSRNRYTLTDAVNLLAAEHRVRLHFVNYSWVDVDDQAAYRYAEKLLLRSLIPPKDGLISRLINRKVSLVITKLLAGTGITPNHVTVISFLLAAASGLSFALANPLLGGLLAQFGSIMDGVDGEIARLKYLKSSYGGIFDAILDRYADYLIVTGMTTGWYLSTGNPLALAIGAAALTGLPMSMLFKEKFHALTGQPYLPDRYDGIFRWLPANRDGRLFLIMLGGIFNLVPEVLVLLAVVTHLLTLFRLYRVPGLKLEL